MSDLSLCDKSRTAERTPDASSGSLNELGFASVGDMQDALDRLVVPETIERVRKGKVKVLEVDNFLPEMPEVEGDSLYFDLVARKDGSLRPDVFLQGCLDATAAADPTFPKLRIAQVTRVAQR